MIKASNAYKSAMQKKIRDRAYISITLGVVNGDAQNTAYFDGDYAYWGNKVLPFRNDAEYTEYATLEQNYMRVDGQMYFLPRETSGLYQLRNAPLTTQNIMETVKVAFPQEYSIKGLTIDFGKYYPTSFKIVTDEKELTYTNDKHDFSTTDVIGDTTNIQIIPISMVGGNKRLRVEKIVMGVGLTYRNNDVSTASFEEFVNGISAEIPYRKLSVTILDKNNIYNVDDDNSFINFLETGQKMELSYGMVLSDETVEWHKKATMLLTDWNSKKNQMSFTANDVLSTLEDNYTIGNKIYDRTAYAEAISILTDAGFEPDEYFVDDCLRDVSLHNPMPEAPHKECLQLLCNASRCILFVDSDGRVNIKANFANVIDPADMQVTSNGTAWWGNATNVLYGNNNVYAELTKSFMRVDGSQFFLPRNTGTAIEQTGYVTSNVSDENGLFSENPVLTLKLPAAYTYYGLYISFQGNPPKEMKVSTYNGDTLLKIFKYDDLKEKSLLNDEFENFDSIRFEITKAYPKNRVLIDKISFGDLSDYELKKDSMTENPYGYAERKTKEVFVKIYTFQNGENNTPQVVEDNIYLKKSINNSGEIRYCENQLISTEEHARTVAEWLGNYYANNISYDVQYRGDPVLEAADIIFMESDIVNSLQVEVEKHKLNFNGAFNGSLQLRRAMRT
jgi:hypothetical protein|nr:MAG TPA: hypothetical protein [Bacteriophage sp.]